MISDQSSLLRKEYISRVNRVQDYIENHLSEDFSLDLLSQIAHFSPFHFHRIFTAISGEPLFQYIQRVRLEKAAYSLMSNQNKMVSEIAVECGFMNQASFTRAFKRRFGISPGKYRENRTQPDSKECKTNSKQGQTLNEIALYNQAIINRKDLDKKTEEISPESVSVQNLLPMVAVYIRHTGPYKQNMQLFTTLFSQLYQWAQARDLCNLPDARWLTVYHSDPEITEEEKLRISVCLTVPENTEVEGELGKMLIPGGKYAVGRFLIKPHQYQNAWNYMFGNWLPDSGFQPDDRNSMEIYPMIQEQDSRKHTVDITIPVKPL